MTELRKRTGADILQQAQADMLEAQEGRMINFLKDTMVEIKNRKHWMKARENQIKNLEELQKQIVKAFDDGNLDTETMDHFNKFLNKIKSQKVSDVMDTIEFTFGEITFSR